MKTQQKITIKIADLGPISMNIAAETEELVRRAEYNVNKVWTAWRASFTDYSSKQVLAMVTFQFAKRYFQLLEQVEKQQAVLDEFEKELDRLLDIERRDDGDSEAQQS